MRRLPVLYWICLAMALQGSNVSVTTNPPGLTILVDGTQATAPQAFGWATASSHTLSVASPQQGGTGTRYVFGAIAERRRIQSRLPLPTSLTRSRSRRSTY
jgi:hypothetical protein